ncbi:hypothetical protein EJV47_14925 [Hymenobacter gummosus]|uniref:DUF2156 domain-containing protein n=1 Tax=Hymenobacter gummosus TaxID=1776032 RepID=A0A431U1D6_9BACT|nr:hypothetical protein [Hymenobacter gummosus]RTQ48887.1 hypothetical protein EJV47_14925 [Hymenobacter gummosus]
MKNPGSQASKGIAVRIDKLTNSIENVISKEVFATVVTPVTSKSLIRKPDWAFDWQKELRTAGRQVFQLTTEDNPTIIQGLISLEEMQGFLYMHLLESATFNKGKQKLYLGVPGNLVAFACKLAFERGHDGYVAFVSKTALLHHYADTLGATPIGGQRMAIEYPAARKLAARYFNDFPFPS